MADDALLERIRKAKAVAGNAPPADSGAILARIRRAREAVAPEAEAKGRALESFTPSMEEQEERTAPPVAEHFGTRMATQPGFELVTEPTMIAAEHLGAGDVRNKVLSTAAMMAEGDPEMAARLRYREKVAKGDLGGRVLAGAKAAEASLPFAFAPLAPGTMTVLTGAGSTETGRKVLDAPAAAGGAAARALGAEEGGAGEAVGRLVVPLAALGLSAGAARAAGRAPATPGVATKVGALPLREVPAGVARSVREGPLVSAAEGAHAASVASGASGMTVGPDVARVLDLDPEGAPAAVANLGAQLGVGALQSAAEGRAMRAGQRFKRMQDLFPERRAKQEARTERLAGEAMEGVPDAIQGMEDARAGRNAELKDLLRETVATEQAKRAAAEGEERVRQYNKGMGAAARKREIGAGVEAGLEEAVEGVAERMKAPPAPKALPTNLLGAAEVLDAPAGSVLKVGDRRGKVVAQSEDGATVRVSFDGGPAESIRATEAEVVWRPGETPEVPYDQPLPTRTRTVEPAPKEAEVPEGRPVSEARHRRSDEILREREADLLPQGRGSKADDMARAYEEMFPGEEPPKPTEDADLPTRMAGEAEKMLAEPEPTPRPPASAADAAATPPAKAVAEEVGSATLPAKALEWADHVAKSNAPFPEIGDRDPTKAEVDAYWFMHLNAAEAESGRAGRMLEELADKWFEEALTPDQQSVVVAGRPKIIDAEVVRKSESLPDRMAREADVMLTEATESLPAEVSQMAKAWGRPAKAEGTVPTKGEQALAGRSIEDLAAAAKKATGRDIRAFKASDGAEFLYDAKKVKKADLLKRDHAGTLWELVGGTARKPAQAKEAVVVRTPEGQEVRTVLAGTPEEAAAAEAVQPEGFTKERIPATDEALQKVVEERKAPPKPPRKPVPLVEGSEVEVTTASRDPDLATVKGRYAVVEAADLLPSHKMGGGKFTVEEDYPQELQPTRYESDAAAQETTRGYRGKFDPNEVLSTAPGVEGGTPTITREGVVLNGNGRAMIVKDLYGSGEGAGYKDAVLSRAEQFGLDAEAVAKMEAPVLVRVADVPEARRQEFAAVGNVSRMKRGSVVAESEKWARIFPDDILESFGDDPDVTLGEALNAGTKEAAAARRRIIGILPEGERNVYYNPKTDRLTPEGQALVREIALRKAGISRETVDLAEPQVQKAIESAAVPLAQLARLFPEQHIGKQVSEALEFYRVHIAGQAEGKAGKEALLADVLKQEALPGLGERASMDAAPRMIMDFVLRNAETPTTFRSGFRSLLSSLQERGSLFPMSDKEMTSQVARALGVTERQGAKWGPKGGSGIVLGAGLGGVQGMKAHQVRAVLGSVLGATSGYLYADETGQDEFSEKAIYAALGAMAGYRVGGGKRGLVDIRKALRGTTNTPYVGPVVGALERALRWSPASVGPAFAEVIRGAQRERLLGDYRAMKKAHALPSLPDGDRQVVYRHLMGERGADADMATLLQGMPKDKADALSAAAENIKRTVRRLADEAVRLGRLSPEARDEYAKGWLQRIYINDLLKGATPFRRFKGNKPALIENRVRQDGYGLILKMNEGDVGTVLAASGAMDPVIALQKGRSTLIKWEDSPEGEAARAKFMESLKDWAQRKGHGPGARGGTGHLVASEFDPLSLQMREALGEKFDPRASSELTLARMEWQNSNARMLQAINGLSDAKGDYTKTTPQQGLQKVVIDGEAHQSFTKNGVEYVVAPDTYGWGPMKGRGVRRDAFEFLNETRASQGKFDEFLDGFIGKWKGAKILTPIGLMRNVWSNFFWYAPAMGIDPLNPANLGYFTKALKMLRSPKGLARVIKEVGADPHIGDRPDIIEGSEAVYQQIRRGSSSDGGARRMGEFMGDLLTGGATMEGQKAHVLALIRAGLGAAAGAAGSDEGERLAGAGMGAAVGLAAGPAIRKIRSLYSSVDPLFKTAAYLKARDRGMSKAQAREEVRKFSQVFSEPGKFTKWSQGKGNWSGRLLGNPFVSFQVENARITANLAKEKPALLAALMLRKEMAGALGLLALAAVGAEGPPGTSKEEQSAARRAFPNLTMGPVPIVGSNGKVRMFDTSQLLPGATDAEGLQTLLGSPEKGKALKDQVFRLGLSNPVLGTLVRAGSTVAAGSEARDPRTGLPYRKRGEGVGEAVLRRTGEELLHPFAPGVGTSFKKLEDVGLIPGLKGKKYEDNLRFEKRRPGWAAFEQGTGIRTRDLDFRPVRTGIENQQRFDTQGAEERLRSDLRDPNLTGTKARRLVVDFRKELKDILKRSKERRHREMPAGAGR